MQHIRVSSQFNPTVEPDLYPEDDDLAATEVEFPIDISRRGDHLIIKAPMVGVKNEEIDLTVNNDILFIHKSPSGEATELVDNYYLQECHWGALSREIHLPVAVDPAGARASLQDGILKIILPILAHKKTRIIKIR